MKSKNNKARIVLDGFGETPDLGLMLPRGKLCIIYVDCLCSHVLSGLSGRIFFNDLYQREENETITSGCCSDRSCCFCLWQKRSPGCSCCPGCCPSSCCCRSSCTCCCSCSCACCCRSSCCSSTCCQVIASAILEPLRRLRKTGLRAGFFMLASSLSLTSQNPLAGWPDKNSLAPHRALPSLTARQAPGYY
jgi:hypothetical protein